MKYLLLASYLLSPDRGATEAILMPSAQACKAFAEEIALSRGAEVTCQPNIVRGFINSNDDWPFPERNAKGE